MILRLLMLLMAFTIPLSAINENKKDFKSAKLISEKTACNSCNSCKSTPSAADLLLAEQIILNNDILLLPQLQPQLIALLQQIIANASGGGSSIGTVGISEYAYIYNLAAQTGVSQEENVLFDTNGLMTAGITHAPGSDSIFIVGTGLYRIRFSVTSQQTNQFALFVNGNLIPGTIYGSGGDAASRQQNTGQVIVTLNAGDTLTLRNHTSSAAAVDLPSLMGGTQANSNASITILKLSS